MEKKRTKIGFDRGRGRNEFLPNTLVQQYHLAKIEFALNLADHRTLNLSNHPTLAFKFKRRTNTLPFAIWEEVLDPIIVDGEGAEWTDLLAGCVVRLQFSGAHMKASGHAIEEEGSKARPASRDSVGAAVPWPPQVHSPLVPSKMKRHAKHLPLISW